MLRKEEPVKNTSRHPTRFALEGPYSKIKQTETLCMFLASSIYLTMQKEYILAANPRVRAALNLKLFIVLQNMLLTRNNFCLL